MRYERIKRILIILSLVLAAELVIMCVLITMETNRRNQRYVPTTDWSLFTEPTQPTTEAATAPTEEETLPAETTEPTEPQPESYYLTFAGDCTLGSVPSMFGVDSGFVKTVGTDYDYPFANVKDIFENDDFTMVNLEGVFAENGTPQDKEFTFRGPTDYTKILTGSSVEAVTLANNHSYDFGQKGYDSTKDALDNAGICYVEENKIRIFTTERGLKIGLYADAFNLSVDDIRENIQKLKNAGAEVIVCAFHWGEEGKYRPGQAQQDFAHAALEAGAHVVFGHHPHVLQRVEQTAEGVIFYSMGNFSFGGNTAPRDMDSVIAQLEIIKDPSGKIHVGQLDLIPACISSAEGYNNYQPTPYEEGTEAYDRVMDKLNGNFTGSDLTVNYEEEPDEPAAETTAEATDPSVEETEPSVEETEPSTEQTEPVTEATQLEIRETEPQQ